MSISLKELLVGFGAGLYKAISFQEELEAIDPGAIVSPPTFAGNGDGEPKQAFIEGQQTDVYLDTHQSQANRIEPLLEAEGLVPRVVVKTDAGEVSVANMGHRAADARIRFSTAADLVKAAFNNPEVMVRNFPATLLFGGWDSRDSGNKIARCVRIYIIARDVTKVPKFGQYRSSFSLDEKDAIGLGNKVLSKEGIPDCPSTSGAVDVLVRGGIFRYGAISLSRISRLPSPGYVLSLALAALVISDDLDLRSNCELVRKPDTRKIEVIDADGNHIPLNINRADIMPFAKSQAAMMNFKPLAFDAWTPKEIAKALKQTDAKKELVEA